MINANKDTKALTRAILKRLMGTGADILRHFRMQSPKRTHDSKAYHLRSTVQRKSQLLM